MNRVAALAVATLAACGDDGGGGTVADAAVDTGMAAKVATVQCPASPAATVMTVNGTDSYMPMASTIPVGGVVRFVMSNTHDVAPNPIGTTDSAIVVGFGQTKCLQFNQAGTYGFYCSAHSFAGTVTVQ